MKFSKNFEKNFEKLPGNRKFSAFKISKKFQIPKILGSLTIFSKNFKIFEIFRKLVPERLEN